MDFFGSASFDVVNLVALKPQQLARIMAVVPLISFLGWGYTVEQVVLMGCTVCPYVMHGAPRPRC